MNKLKQARQNKDLSQVEVAKQVGIAVRQYQRYEYGEREPKASLSLKIAEVLETTVEELFKNI